MHEITKYFLFTENQKQMSESVLSHPCRAGVRPSRDRDPSVSVGWCTPKKIVTYQLKHVLGGLQ